MLDLSLYSSAILWHMHKMTGTMMLCKIYSVSGKKWDQIVFRNIFYKTLAILIKFDTWFS